MTHQETVDRHDTASNTSFSVMKIDEAMAQAQYNDAGVAMTMLGAYEIGNQQIDVLLVSMKPGVSVAQHLHNEGGESQMALTPVRAVFGKPRKDSQNEYILNEEGHVSFDPSEDRIFTPNEIVTIPAGFVHGYSNPSQEHAAHIIFNLPHSHTTAEDKLLADPSP